MQIQHSQKAASHNLVESEDEVSNWIQEIEKNVSKNRERCHKGGTSTLMNDLVTTYNVNFTTRVPLFSLREMAHLSFASFSTPSQLVYCQNLLKILFFFPNQVHNTVNITTFIHVYS